MYGSPLTSQHDSLTPCLESDFSSGLYTKSMRFVLTRDAASLFHTLTPSSVTCWTPPGRSHSSGTLRHASPSYTHVSYCASSCSWRPVPSLDLCCWHALINLQAMVQSKTPAFRSHQPLVSLLPAMNWLVGSDCSSLRLRNRQVTFFTLFTAAQSVLISSRMANTGSAHPFVSTESNTLFLTTYYC